MGFLVGVAVASEAEPGGVGVATEVLQRRLEELTGRAGSWRDVRSRPRDDAPQSMGTLQDIVLDFGGELLPDTVLLVSGYLVRAIVGHLRTQPDPTQTVEITSGGEVFLVTPGMTAEELAAVEVRFAEWIARQQSGGTPPATGADDDGTGASDSPERPDSSDSSDGEDGRV